MDPIYFEIQIFARGPTWRQRRTRQQCWWHIQTRQRVRRSSGRSGIRRKPMRSERSGIENAIGILLISHCMYGKGCTPWHVPSDCSWYQLNLTIGLSKKLIELLIRHSKPGQAGESPKSGPPLGEIILEISQLPVASHQNGTQAGL